MMEAITQFAVICGGNKNAAIEIALSIITGLGARSFTSVEHKQFIIELAGNILIFARRLDGTYFLYNTLTLEEFSKIYKENDGTYTYSYPTAIETMQ